MHAPISSSGGSLPALTSIRFLAAITVVVSHYSELGLLNLPREIFEFFDGGRPAVSLFFVLSGFILTFTYRDQLAIKGNAAFYQARFARIYPVVLLGLVLCVPTTLYLLHGDNPSLLLQWYAVKSSVHLAIGASLLCQLLLLNAWFPFAAINQPWNGPSDSVSCEAFFYLLFPLMLRKMLPVPIARLTLACVGFFLLQGLWILFLQTCLPASRSGFLIVGLPLTRLFEFVAGIYAAILFLQLREARADRHALALKLISGALITLVVLALWHPFSPAFYLASPLFAALILGLALMDRPVINFLNQRILIKLGEASYSLYLIHVPIAYLAYIAGFRQSNGWLAVVFAVAASVVIFRFYEEPMRKRIRAGFSHAATSGDTINTIDNQATATVQRRS
ncbi:MULTISPECIES: acyltransferase family protein [Burkholderiaceae]|uniref:Acyltransferase n=1 Tax=Caballeronia sordidicola TaxID=196367 RepID=A0A242N4X6_CABSO|nr:MULTISPECIES: acyltransferase [Burkholderiaceae]AME26376.1 acyltransferase [Burkholderia sp. PAMC 26561]OTP78711.1 Acyltransferase [Caballeronia sordidicola]